MHGNLQITTLQASRNDFCCRNTKAVGAPGAVYAGLEKFVMLLLQGTKKQLGADPPKLLAESLAAPRSGLVPGSCAWVVCLLILSLTLCTTLSAIFSQHTPLSLSFVYSNSTATPSFCNPPLASASPPLRVISFERERVSFAAGRIRRTIPTFSCNLRPSHHAENRVETCYHISIARRLGRLWLRRNFLACERCLSTVTSTFTTLQLTIRPGHGCPTSSQVGDRPPPRPSGRPCAIMSSNSSSSQSPPRVPPHIRLNSGQAEARTDGNGSRQLIPPNSRPGTSKSQLQNAYSSTQIQDSAERLLPPSRGQTDRFQDNPSPARSPMRSSYNSSRRSSWDSERSRDSRGFENPFRDSSQSRPGSRADSEDADVNTQTVSEKYNILPSAGLLLFPEDVEKDDYLHNPDPGGEPRDCDIFTRRGIVNVGGLFLMTLGLLALFIGYPVL